MKHVMSFHKSEFEVQLIESKPKRSKEHALLKEKLRLKGNYKHNYNVIRKGSGKIIPDLHLLLLLLKSMYPVNFA